MIRLSVAEKRIAAKGIYRDPVRSSDSHLVKASGLRWSDASGADSLGTAGLGITVSNRLSPFSYHEQRNHRHKQLTDWARQMIRQVRRWLPRRTMVVVADSSFAALELLWALCQMSQCISSLAYV